ncbi:MAG: RNA-processing protein [Thermoplasmatales archaeon]|nr:RNA-processing protein [Thermoplasmatales archaeon]
MKYIKIPMERIAVVIGHNGETKRDLEDKSRVRLEIDSKLGEIAIDDRNVDDPLRVLKLENIILAIGRGFSPEHAVKLLNDNTDLFIFDIHDYVSKKESHVRRLKSRIIGTEGKTKRILEGLTDSYISVYGHTVSIITDFVSMNIAKRAIDKLLSGSKHATVYRFIESNMRQLRLGGKL